MNINRLDLYILKTITENKIKGVEFSNTYHFSLFDDNVQDFAKYVINYIKTYRDLPTRRTLSLTYKDDGKIIEYIDEVWDELDECDDYSESEYSFFLEEFKDRYSKKNILEIKNNLNKIEDINDINNIEYIKKNIALNIQNINLVNSGKSFIQKTVKEYVSQFEEEYIAKEKNPNSIQLIETGYSGIDHVTHGFAPAELVIIGGETSAGKALAIDTPIITSNGWMTMENLQVGDYVLDEYNKHVKVIAISDIMVNRPCYELTFSNNETIIADANHSWKTFTTQDNENVIKTTEEIYETIDHNHMINDIKISSVKKVDSVPVKCIQVESKSHMFLCGKKMIPTHNSMLLSNISIQMWMQGNTILTPASNYNIGYNVLYFSLEMPFDDCHARFLARVANVPQTSITLGKLDMQEKKRVELANAFIKDYPAEFGIVDAPRGITIEELELRYTDALLKYKPDIVVVDYLSLMNDPKLNNAPDWLKLSGIAESLHQLSRVYGVVLLTAVQLTDIKRGKKSKEIKEMDDDDEQRVGLHRIGRSSLIMHHANVAIQIEKRQDEMNLPDFKYHIIKNRRGPLLYNGYMSKNFSNASLLDRSYVPTNMAINMGGEDISNKIDISKLKGIE